METSAKYILLGPADYKKRLSNKVRSCAPRFIGLFSTEMAPPAGSGNGTRSESFVRERGHRICTSLQQGNRVLHPVFHSSKEGLGVASHFRSSSSERLRHAAQVEDVNFETNRATDQIRGLVYHCHGTEARDPIVSENRIFIWNTPNTVDVKKSTAVQVQIYRPCRCRSHRQCRCSEPGRAEFTARAENTVRTRQGIHRNVTR